jgi:hypothetical protein
LKPPSLRRECQSSRLLGMPFQSANIRVHPR